MKIGDIMSIACQYIMLAVAGYLIVLGLGQLPLRFDDIIIKHYAKKKERLAAKRDFEEFRDIEEEKFEECRGVEEEKDEEAD